MHAAARGRLQLVTLLLEKGAQLEARGKVLGSRNLDRNDMY